MQHAPPESIDLLIEARWIATVDQPEILKNHAVAVTKGRIVDILPAAQARQRYQAKIAHRLDTHLLIPGLINLHTHAAMSLMRGMADDLPLMTWLQKHIWPTERRHVSYPFVLDGSRLACAEMLLGGITCFNDMYFFPDATAQAASEFGMRAHIGITTLDFPSAYASDAQDYLNKGIEAKNQWEKHPLIQFCLAPHAPYTVSDQTFREIATLSQQLCLPIHCHLHETQDEIAQSITQYQLRPIARLEKLGLIDSTLIGVHAVHLDEAEIELFAQRGVHIAHCPTSNLKLASGIAPIHAMQQAGISIGIGTDGAASNNRLDLLGDMRLAALLAKGVSGDASALPAHEVLRMATINGARALGLEGEIGSITLGKSADFCAVNLGSIHTQPCFDPVSHLIYAASREHISHVWVRGECCVDNHQLTSPHINGLDSALSLWQNRLEVFP